MPSYGIFFYKYNLTMFREENKYQHEVVRTGTNHVVKLTNVREQTKNRIHPISKLVQKHQKVVDCKK